MHMSTAHITITAMLLAAAAITANIGIIRPPGSKPMKYLSGILFGMNITQLCFYVGLVTEQTLACSILTAIAMYATMKFTLKWLSSIRDKTPKAQTTA